MGMIEIPDPADMPFELRPKAKVMPTIPDVDPDLMPKVQHWYVMILPVVIPEKSAGGVHLAPDTIKHREMLRTVGKVIGIGPRAYEKGEPSCEVGDWVVFHSLNGAEIPIHDRAGRSCSLKFINDDQVLAVVESPEILMVTF